MTVRKFRGLVFLFVVVAVLVGTRLSLHGQKAYRPATGYAFWSKADDNLKSAYLFGYYDAEQLYRTAMDKGVAPICGDAGKTWITDFEQKLPLPESATVVQLKEGLDEFYRDWKNQGVDLGLAQRVVRLQLAGRPAAEIDEATRRARQVSSNR
jgi:hypothetical protein